MFGLGGLRFLDDTGRKTGGAWRAARKMKLKLCTHGLSNCGTMEEKLTGRQEFKQLKNQRV